MASISEEQSIGLGERKRILSGMRPTGKLHLGNYMGALHNWAKLQHEYECYFFIADLHALTTDYADLSEIKTNRSDVMLDFLAGGLDPNLCTLFVQNKIPAHSELFTLLTNITPISWLERVPTYKDQQEQLREKDLATYGFLGYPLLQSADILLYKPKYVPVGQDQAAHVEITREIARRFNHLYGARQTTALEHAHSDKEKLAAEMTQSDSQIATILPEPDVLLTPSPKLPGLDGRKMSKSYKNTILLSEEEPDIRAKLKGMVTDPARVRRTDPGNPDVCPVFDLHKVFSSTEVQAEAAEGCRTAGIGCIQCKGWLADAVVKELGPIQERRRYFEANPDEVAAILEAGNARANERANPYHARGSRRHGDRLVEVLRSAEEVEAETLSGRADVGVVAGPSTSSSLREGSTQDDDTEVERQDSGEPFALEPKPVPTQPEPKRIDSRKNAAEKEEASLSPFSVTVGQVYDGPFDLLLDLIRKQNIDIYDIPIAKITSQFLEYTHHLKQVDVDAAGEFIYMASLLIHIKSKTLLPRDPLDVAAGADSEDPRRELVERLLEHERFKAAAQMLMQKQQIEEATWSNPGLRAFKDEADADREIAADTVDLVRVFRDVLDRLKERPVLNVDEESVTVAQMIEYVKRRLLMEEKPVSLRKLLHQTHTERAVICMFLAMLELVRLQAVLLHQPNQMGDILIKKTENFDSVFEHEEQTKDDWR